jgi:hypothetical protein
MSTQFIKPDLTPQQMDFTRTENRHAALRFLYANDPLYCSTMERLNAFKITDPVTRLEIIVLEMAKQRQELITKAITAAILSPKIQL